MQRAYVGSSLALSALAVLLGLTLIVSSVARGGGLLALGVVVGAAMSVAGGLRLWLLLGARSEHR
jgi:hypothetical protein